MKYLNWNEFYEYNKWQKKQKYYGNAIKIQRKIILGIITIICLITPFTNWFIPISTRIIKTGITLRWD
jgi:ABC-type lipoprotein release transport system permease subunit